MSIVVGVDGGPNEEPAVREALTTAASIGPATVHFVHVVPLSYAQQQHDLNADAASLMERIQGIAAQTPLSPNGHPIELVVHVRAGIPAKRILEVARKHEAELIILGADRHHNHIGSTIASLLEGSLCDVQLVSRQQPWAERLHLYSPHRETHTYGAEHRTVWARHNSDTTGPTGIAMVEGAS